MDISRAKDILNYWFSKGVYAADYDKWFMKSQDYDEEIREKFGDLLKEAEQGKGFGWLHTKDSYIAYIILLDQFSRHIYRGSGDSFKNDNGCMIFVELGSKMYMDQLKGYEFMFVFMPYMHTEKYEYSRIGKQIYERYKSGGEAKVRKLQSRITPTSVGELRNLQMEMKMLKEMQIHVLGHFQTLMQYGRFPKRNEALGRKSTEQEIYYMERPEVKKRPY
tara:strand:- start:1564 stop:2223 length:660 start_codon:yes stop_codon:yes gene_type:complete